MNRGSAPNPEVYRFAFSLTNEKSGRTDRPIRISQIRQTAQVAPQHCPILQDGKSNAIVSIKHGNYT